MAKKYRSIVLFVLLLSAPAYADSPFYGVIRFGSTKMQHHPDDGWWWQSRYEHTFDEQSNNYGLGLGWKFTERAALELDFQNFGEYNGYSGWTQPDSTYDMGGNCVGACNPTQYGFLHAEVRGVTLSGTYTYPVTKKLGLMARAGLFYVKTNFVERHSLNRDDPNNSRIIQEPDPYRTTYHTQKYINHAFDTMAGAGITYERFSLEYTWFPGMGQGQSPFRDVSTITVSYKLPF